MKKLLIIPFVVALVYLSQIVLTPNHANSATVNSEYSNPRSTSFRILICDGPDELRHFDPKTQKMDPEYSEPGYIACDFNGVILQIRHLISLMIIVGVIAAILGIVYAGLLYISGEKDKIEKAKKMLPTIGKGFVIMLAAWFIVYQILSWLASNDGVGQAVKKILEG